MAISAQPLSLPPYVNSYDTKNPNSANGKLAIEFLAKFFHGYIHLRLNRFK